MPEIDHESINAAISSQGGYGKGIDPNPYAEQCVEWRRRAEMEATIALITKKIRMLFEPRFITPPETSECIEAITTMSDSRKILELGTYTGFGALHILRAIVGKPGAHLVSIDARPAHDAEFFSQFPFTQVPEWTPGCFAGEAVQAHAPYDLVFVDSDHSVDHTSKELTELMKITRPGSLILFHDLPASTSMENPNPPPVRVWLENLVKKGSTLQGWIFPTCEQLDCRRIFGPGYPSKLNPHLGVFVRV